MMLHLKKMRSAEIVACSGCGCPLFTMFPDVGRDEEVIVLMKLCPRMICQKHFNWPWIDRVKEFRKWQICLFPMRLGQLKDYCAGEFTTFPPLFSFAVGLANGDKLIYQSPTHNDRLFYMPFKSDPIEIKKDAV